MATKIEKFRVLKNLTHPIKDEEKVQKFIDEVDSEYYSYTMAVKALKLAGKRIEFVLQHEDTDDFDLPQELEDVLNIIGFALKNL